MARPPIIPLDNRLLRHAAFIGALLSFIMLVGTVGFVVIEGYSVVFDAFYMTLIPQSQPSDDTTKYIHLVRRAAYSTHF